MCLVGHHILSLIRGIKLVMTSISEIQKWVEASYTTLTSSFRFMPNYKSLNLIFTGDPFYIFNRIGFVSAMQDIADVEFTMFDKPEDRTLAEGLTTSPYIGYSHPTSQSELNIVSERVNGNTVTDVFRQRGRFRVLFTPLIHITTAVICFDKRVRARATPRLLELGYCPTYLFEMLKRIRECSNFLAEFTIGLSLTGWTKFVNAFPEFKGTLWDPEFLMTDAGLDAYIAILSRIKLSNSLVVPMTLLKAGSIPALNSGFVVTSTAITVESTHDILNSNIYSFFNTIGIPIAGYFLDALSFTTYYVDASGQEFTAHRPFSPSVVSGGTFSTFLTSLVHRVTGSEPNSYLGRRAPTEGDPAAESELDAPRAKFSKSTKTTEATPKVAPPAAVTPNTPGNEAGSSPNAGQRPSKRTFRDSRTRVYDTREIAQIVQVVSYVLSNPSMFGPTPFRGTRQRRNL